MQALKSLSESSSEVISLVTAAGRVIYASASSFDAFGYRPEEMVGLDSLDLIHPEDRDHSRRALGAVVARPPGPRHVRVRVRRKDGEFSRVESTISNFLDEPRIGAIVVNYRVNYREIGAGRARNSCVRMRASRILLTLSRMI
jgi:PAS domain S-box-containing protein